MANLFTISGEIFLDNTRANKAIEETTGKTEKSEGGFSKFIGTAGKVGAAVLGGATVAAGAMTSMVKKTTDATGAIADSAKKTGMSAESFQQWAYAAKLSGMEASTLESAMVKQQRAFSDAASGSKTAQAAYAALGLDVSKLGSSGEAFDQVIAKLADMDDETQRNAIANDIFGKSYAELSPLLAEGSKGIDAMKKEAVDLGAVMSDEAVASGEQLGDTIDKLTMAAGGMFNQLGTSLIPIVQTFADIILENMPMIQGLFEQIAPVLADFFAQAMPVLLELVQQLLPVIFQIIQALLPIIVALLPLFMSIIQSILPPLLELLKLLLPPLMKLLNLIIPPLTAVVKILADVFGDVLSAAISGLTPVIEALTRYLGGIIDFVTGVFTGDWSKAWQGIVNIFGGIFDGIKALIKAPLNYVIDMINSLFSKIGSIDVPDWVPIIGGKNFSIPKIPRLAVGLDYVPYDEFPALLHKGERVLTAEENKKGYSGGIVVNIEHFENNREQDVKQLAEELEYYRQRKAAAYGVA